MPQIKENELEMEDIMPGQFTVGENLTEQEAKEYLKEIFADNDGVKKVHTFMEYALSASEFADEYYGTTQEKNQ